MVTFLLENGKIETTVTRAKEVKAMTEKIITKAKAVSYTHLDVYKRQQYRSERTHVLPCSGWF